MRPHRRASHIGAASLCAAPCAVPLAALLAVAALGCIDIPGPDDGGALGALAPGTNLHRPPKDPPPGTEPVVLVPFGAAWQWADGGVEEAGQGAAWKTYQLQSGSWPEGPAPLGYGEDYIATTIDYGPDPANKYPTYYFRQRVGESLDREAEIQALTLNVMVDDGFVFYLDGREGGRAYLPLTGPIGYATLAVGHDVTESYESYDVSAQILNFVPGSLNSLAVEVHQASVSSSDVVFDAELVAWVTRT
jgi:hypothetical protein